MKKSLNPLSDTAQKNDTSVVQSVFDSIAAQFPNDYTFLNNAETAPEDPENSAPFSGVKTPEQQEQEDALAKVGTEEEIPGALNTTVDQSNPETWVGDNDPGVFEGRPELEKAHQEYAGDALFRLPVYGMVKTYLNVIEAGADLVTLGGYGETKLNLEDYLLSDEMKSWIKPHTKEIQKMAPMVSIFYGSYLMGKVAGAALGKIPIAPQLRNVFSNGLSYFINTDIDENNTNLINASIDAMPWLKDTILDYFAFDKNDNGLERRLKNVGYNFLLDGILNYMVIKPLKAAWRWQRTHDEKKWAEELAARAVEIDENNIMAAGYGAPPAPTPLQDYITMVEKEMKKGPHIKNAKWLKEADDEIKGFLELDPSMTDKQVVEYFSHAGETAETVLKNSMRAQAVVVKQHMLPDTMSAYLTWKFALDNKAPAAFVAQAKDAYIKNLGHLLYGIEKMGETVGRSGRLLQFVKVLDNANTTIDPLKNLNNAADSVSQGLVDMLNQTFADDAALIELGESIFTLGQAGTSVGAISAFVNKTMNEAAKPLKWYEVLNKKLKFYYYNALLSGPRTIMRNIVGEGSSVYGTRGMDVMFEGLWRGQGFKGARERAAAYYRGLTSGWEKQKEIFWASLRTGNPAVDGLMTFAGQERKTIHMLNSPKTLYEKVMGSPTRMNTAIDQSLGYAARLGHLEVQFYDFMHGSKIREKIWNEGMQAAAGTKANNYLAMVRRQWFKAADPFKDVAIAPGEILTKTAANNTVNGAFGINMIKANQLSLRDLAKQPMGKITQGIKTAVDNFPGGFILVPFLSTPVNLAKNTLYYHSPLRIFELLQNSVDDNARAQILGEITTGLVLWGTAFSAVMAGTVIGSGPQTKAGREAWAAQGIIPNSIHIGNTYVSINDIGPAADPFIIMANLVDSWRSVDKDDPFGDKDLMEIVRNTADAIFSYAADKSYLRTLGNVVDAMRDERSLKRLMLSTAGGFVPAALQTARQITDPVQRQVGTRDRYFGENTLGEFGNSLLNRLPLLSHTLPEKVSWLNGMPAELPYSAGFGPFIQPMFWNMTKGKNEEEVVATTLAKMRSVNGPTQDNAFGFNIDDQTYSEFCREMGTIRVRGLTLYETLDRLIRSRRFENLGPDPSLGVLNSRKEKEINKILGDFRRAASERYMRTHPDLRQFYVQLTRWENQMKTNTPPDTPRPVYDRLTEAF